MYAQSYDRNLAAVLLAGLLACLVFAAAGRELSLPTTPPQVYAAAAPLPKYTPHEHAEWHSEAADVRTCTENGKSVMTFRGKRFSNRFAWLCQLPDGRWGVHVLEKVGEKWQEITAFVIGGAVTSGGAVEYLLRQYTKFTGLLP